jgi:hypothetical protein
MKESIPVRPPFLSSSIIFGPSLVYQNIHNSFWILKFASKSFEAKLWSCTTGFRRHVHKRLLFMQSAYDFRTISSASWELVVGDGVVKHTQFKPVTSALMNKERLIRLP